MSATDQVLAIVTALWPTKPSRQCCGDALLGVAMLAILYALY